MIELTASFRSFCNIYLIIRFKCYKMDNSSNVLSKFRQFYYHSQDKCIYNKERTYIRDKEKKETNHPLVSLTRNPKGIFIMR